MTGKELIVAIAERTWLDKPVMIVVGEELVEVESVEQFIYEMGSFIKIQPAEPLRKEAMNAEEAEAQ